MPTNQQQLRRSSIGRPVNRWLSDIGSKDVRQVNVYVLKGVACCHAAVRILFWEDGERACVSEFSIESIASIWK